MNNKKLTAEQAELARKLASGIGVISGTLKGFLGPSKTVIVKVGKQASTNGVNLMLPPEVILRFDQDREMMLGLTYHELGHVLFTNFDERPKVWKSLVGDFKHILSGVAFQRNLLKSELIWNEPVVASMVHDFDNIVEDYRVETLMKRIVTNADVFFNEVDSRYTPVVSESLRSKLDNLSEVEFFKTYLLAVQQLTAIGKASEFVRLVLHKGAARGFGYEDIQELQHGFRQDVEVQSPDYPDPATTILPVYRGIFSKYLKTLYHTGLERLLEELTVQPQQEQNPGNDQSQQDDQDQEGSQGSEDSAESEDTNEDSTESSQENPEEQSDDSSEGNSKGGSEGDSEEEAEDSPAPQLTAEDDSEDDKSEDDSKAGVLQVKGSASGDETEEEAEGNAQSDTEADSEDNAEDEAPFLGGGSVNAVEHMLDNDHTPEEVLQEANRLAFIEGNAVVETTISEKSKLLDRLTTKARVEYDCGVKVYHPKPTETKAEVLEDMLTNNAGLIDRVGRHLRQELVGFDRRVANERAKKGSRVHRSNVAKVASGLMVRRPFAGKSPYESENTAISICCDVSSSMDGHVPYKDADGATRVTTRYQLLQVALLTLGVVLGKNESSKLAFNVFSYGDDISEVKTFGERFSLKGLSRMPCSHGNTHGYECTQAAVESLMQAKQERKILICLTDGDWDPPQKPVTDNPYSFIYENGIEVYGIMLGSSGFSNTPDFTGSMTISDISNLPSVLCELFTKILHESRKVRQTLQARGKIAA